MPPEGSPGLRPGGDGLLRAGAGKATITPPVGFGIHNPEFELLASTGIDDGLYARAFVFDAEGRRVVICSLDVYGIRPELQSQIRNAVADAAGTHAPFVWLTCTGNATSPPTWSGAGDHHEYARYLSYLPDICGGAATDAVNTLQSASSGTGTGRLTDVATGVDGPGHEIDETVTLVSVVDSHRETIGQLVSYSCPAVVRGDHQRWTGDYPAYASWTLERAGGGATAFARGSDADARPFNWFRGNTSRTHASRAAEDVKSLGMLLATQATAIASNDDIEYTRAVSTEVASDDDLGAHVLRIGPLVCIGIDRPQPSVFAKHLRTAMPRSQVVVSTNVAGMRPEDGEELDVSLELDTLEIARSAGAM